MKFKLFDQTNYATINFMVGMDIVVTTNYIYTLTMMKKATSTNAIHIAKMDKLFSIQA